MATFEILTGSNVIGGGSGSSYLVWDAAYQNSAMSSTMGAYLYKDAGGVIWKVYEPTMNNVVSRSQYGYEDSIDLFPFDNGAFENELSDVKLIDVGSGTIFQGNKLKDIVIDGNSHTGLELINNIAIGNYGTGTPNLAELYIAGNNVVIHSNTFGGFETQNGEEWYMDSISAGFNISGSHICGRVTASSVNGIVAGVYLGVRGIINFNGKSTCSLVESNIYQRADVSFQNNNGTGNEVMALPTSVIIIGDSAEAVTLNPGGSLRGDTNEYFAGILNVIIGCNSVVKPSPTNTIYIANTSVGNGCTITTTGDVSGCTFFDSMVGSIGTKTNKQFMYQDVAYELGVSGGNVTATAI